MDTIIKRLQGLLIILLMLTFCGCGASPAPETNPENSPTGLSDPHISTGAAADSPAAMDPEHRKQVRLEIHSDKRNKINIPDPAGITEDVVTISLQTEADSDDLYNPETDEWLEGSSLNNRYLADLSFAGLGEDAMVSAYTVGSMTDPRCRTENCLALFVHKNPQTEQEKNYFLVVDYGHGTYYLTETNFFFHDWRSLVDLEARDLTGDGTQELVVSHIYNKSIDVGVFRCDQQSHTLISLFSTLDALEEENGGDTDRSWFRGHLEDDYKVVLEFPQIQYSKRISMVSDGGYPQKYLEIGSPDRYDDGGINFVALWKDGILQKKKVDSDTVFLYTLDHVDYATGKSGIPQLELVRGIFVGHRSEQIGNMHLFLQYDPDEDRLTLKKAKYVNEKQAEKEWESFDEWDDE